MSAFSALVARELKLAFRAGGEAMVLVLFFVMVGVIVPFAIGPDRPMLTRLSPGIVWIAAFLSTLLGLDRLLQADEEDGVIDELMVSETPLELILMVKALAHWLVTGLPLAILAPVLGLMLAIAPAAMLPLALSLLVGTPALTFLGLVGAALTVTLRRGGLLLSVLVLPLTAPILIFGVSIIKEAAEGRAFTTPLALLSGITLIAIVVSPIAAAAALRMTRQ